MLRPPPASPPKRLGLSSTRSLAVLRAFVQGEHGQDVIEYGLLSAFFGIVCIAVWLSIEGNLRAAYLGYDAGVQNLWESPDPVGP